MNWKSYLCFLLSTTLLGIVGEAQGVERACSQTVAALVKSNTAYDTSKGNSENEPVEYRVTIGPSGYITSLTKTKSSGYPDFDSAVSRALEKSQPFPKCMLGAAEVVMQYVHRPMEANH